MASELGQRSQPSEALIDDGEASMVRMGEAGKGQSGRQRPLVCIIEQRLGFGPPRPRNCEPRSGVFVVRATL